MAFDEGLAERIRGVLQDERGVTEKKMFGGLAFMLDGKMCCGVMKDELLVRVSDTAAALATPHTRPMTFTGKPFKGFVLVTADGLDAERDLERWVLGGAAVAHTLTTRPRTRPLPGERSAQAGHGAQ